MKKAIQNESLFSFFYNYSSFFKKNVTKSLVLFIFLCCMIAHVAQRQKKI